MAWLGSPRRGRSAPTSVSRFGTLRGSASVPAGWDFYITTSAWREEVCAGLNPKALAGTLAERGMLIVPENGSHRAKSESVPGYGKLRLYHIPARFLEDAYE